MSNLTLNGNTSGVNYNKAPSVPSVPSSPTRLRPQKSMSKLNSKPSILKMKLEELYNPVASPRGRYTKKLNLVVLEVTVVILSMVLARKILIMILILILIIKKISVGMFIINVN